ncbi:MAG TPA: NUDIX domain-containing protein [Humibacter sp.]|jgi:8-oxo-dGTP pyrophosphatase MutT (NUDIX family)|nr:NUDIX domain-containing protein [Humibacter sp.]
MPTPDFILALREKIGTHPLWLSGVTAVVLRGEGDDVELLCVRRADTGEWTPVTGIIDPGEQPAVAAEREVLEEASVVAVAERLASVGVSHAIEYANGDQAQYLDLTFRCRWVSGEPAVGDDENTDARWFPVAQLPPMDEGYASRIHAAVADEPHARFRR